MYRVIVNFTDLQDGRKTYTAGDMYPRKGYTPTEKRIRELLSSTNKIGKPVIERTTKEEPAVETTSKTETVEELSKRKKRRTKDEK